MVDLKDECPADSRRRRTRSVPKRYQDSTEDSFEEFAQEVSLSLFSSVVRSYPRIKCALQDSNTELSVPGNKKSQSGRNKVL